MADDIERWSEELARDPTSGVFIPLADALRRRGQLDLAVRVATRGLARRPYDGDAHDLLARIWADRGDVQRAIDEWSMALQCAPRHPGALKGMGFACYKAGRLAEAEHYLAEASAVDPDDATTHAAIVRVRQQIAGVTDSPAQPVVDGSDGQASTPAAPERAVAPTPRQSGGARQARVSGPVRRDSGSARAKASADPRDLFADVLEGADQAALVVDGSGLVLAGCYVIADGRDVGPEVGGALTGVSEEARRAMRHLDLGTWSSLVFETEAATVGMAPLDGGPLTPEGDRGPSIPGTVVDGVAFFAAGPSVPLGLVRRLLARVVARATTWLGEADRGRAA